MTNTLKNFAKKIEQQNKDRSNRISPLETCLMATLDEFEHYIHQAIPACTKKEEIGMLKSKIETLKEENSKLRRGMCEKETLKKHDGNIKQTKGQTKVANRNPTNAKVSTSSRYTIRHEKQICSTSNTQDEVLDKEAKNYKEKKTLQYPHQTPVYRKQNHLLNPIINHLPENRNPLRQKRAVPGISKYSDIV